MKEASVLPGLRPATRNTTSPWLIDSSLSLVNRTGAFYIARDLCQAFVPEYARVRHWRLGARAADGMARKIAARLMMLEMSWLSDRRIFPINDTVAEDSFRLFLDPLYVLRSGLEEKDIVLCHDVGPLTHSALYDARTVENYRLAYDKIRRHRPGIVFVSDWSRHNFMALQGADFPFLETIPLYVRTEAFDGPSEPARTIDGPFLLTVGAFEARKNQIAALKAYRDGRFHERGFKYVLCGSRGAGHEDILDFAGTVPGVVILNYVPDAQLRWLYAHAEAFVLPSLLEGFGMPALEAAYMGLLPIVSANSALVEAVEGLCVQVSATDPEAIAAAMQSALARSLAEKAQTSRQLRKMASAATKERFLDRWRDLLIAHRDSLRKPPRI